MRTTPAAFFPSWRWRRWLLFLGSLMVQPGLHAAMARSSQDPPARASGASRPLFDIVAAVAAAGPGDTVVVPPGTYDGNLTIGKRLALVGREKPVLRGDGRGSVITVTADSCVVRGFIVEHSGTMLVDEDAGILLKSDHNVVDANELRDILFGIYLYHAEDNLIAGNTVLGRPGLPLGERGSGMHIWNSQRNRFIGNTMTGVRDGFYIQNANNTWIEGNTAFGVRYGLHYMYADSNVFLGNRFFDNVAGAAIMYSRDIVMRDNVFAHNRGFSSFGVLFQDCHGLRADSNVIDDNVVGLFFEASTDNSFRHNVIARNDVALEMFQNSVDNVFAENNFVDNLNPLAVIGKRTESRWSLEGRGNYWSSYDGFDLDGDGIGDVPMNIRNVFAFLEGRNENVRVYLYSPASQALAVAAKAFPIIDVNEEVDPRPLMRPVEMSALPAVRMMPLQGDAAGSTGVPRLWSAVPLAGALAAGALYRRLSRRAT